MDLFHREALIRMLEILIASIISLSPLIHTLHLHSIPPSIHPFLHRHSNCLRMRKKQSAMLKSREKGERKMGKAKEKKRDVMINEGNMAHVSRIQLCFTLFVGMLKTNKTPRRNCFCDFVLQREKLIELN